MVFGKNGWIGGIVINLLRERGYTVYEADSRLENTQDVCDELDRVKPDYVINAAGLVFFLDFICIIHRQVDPMLIGASHIKKM
jgi:nucleoside-diphosphate-sugar epimerase